MKALMELEHGVVLDWQYDTDFNRRIHIGYGKFEQCVSKKSSISAHSRGIDTEDTLFFYTLEGW